MLSNHICSSSCRSIIASTSRSLSLRYYPQLAFTTSSRRTETLSTLRQSRSASVDLSRKDPEFADLGLREKHPPDSTPDPKNKGITSIPDHEWELRTGRAIYVLQETLPRFFNTGLITSVDKTTGSPSLPKSGLTPAATVNFLEYYVLDHDDEHEPVYSSSIVFSYTPPGALPSPFPKTFHIDGLQLYLTSSSFLRHTMNALYSDLSIDLTKFVVNTPKATATSEAPAAPTSKRRINREKNVVVRQIVTGLSRVSGKPGEWEVESTYTFSPLTGLIQSHVIDSIHPAPHQAVYDSIRMSFGKVLGLGWPGTGAPGGAACKGKLSGPRDH